jgi:hypothetical protein
MWRSPHRCPGCDLRHNVESPYDIETLRRSDSVAFPGLNHVAITVRGHGGIVDAPYGSGLSFRDPDNIALELFAPPKVSE